MTMRPHVQRLEYGKRVAAFDGLRAFAAIYVVMFHIINAHPDFASMSVLAKSVVAAGANTVPIFFVLSGIFIMSSLRNLLETKTRPRTDFAIRRFFRIMPLWWILLIWMWWIGWLAPEVLFANSVFYFGDRILGSKWLAVVPAWSLAVEVCFYVVIGIFAKISVKTRGASLLIFWLLSCFVTVVWRYLAAEVLKIENFPMTTSPLNHISYFVAGIAIERWYHSGGRLESWLAPHQVKVMEILVIALLLLNSVPNFHIFPLEVLAPLIVILTGASTSFLNKLTSRRLSVELGRASYGIYILQVMAGLNAVRWFGSGGLLFAVLTQTTVSILFGLISYHAVERPFIALGRRWQSARLS